MTIGMDDGKFYLIDNFPGIVTNGPNPSDWTAPSSTPDFPVGTKRAIYDDTNNGWSIMCFLKYEKGSANAAAIKNPCAPDDTESIEAGAWYIVTNDGGECLLNGPIAVALATLADGEYAWFWVGGVCPVDLVSGLNGKFNTGGNATAGAAMMLSNQTIAQFALYTANTTGIISAFCLADDEDFT